MPWTRRKEKQGKEIPFVMGKKRKEQRKKENLTFQDIVIEQQVKIKMKTKEDEDDGYLKGLVGKCEKFPIPL